MNALCISVPARIVRKGLNRLYSDDPRRPSNHPGAAGPLSSKTRGEIRRKLERANGCRTLVRSEQREWCARRDGRGALLVLREGRLRHDGIQTRTHAAPRFTPRRVRYEHAGRGVLLTNNLFRRRRWRVVPVNARRRRRLFLGERWRGRRFPQLFADGFTLYASRRRFARAVRHRSCFARELAIERARRSLVDTEREGFVHFSEQASRGACHGRRCAMTTNLVAQRLPLKFSLRRGDASFGAPPAASCRPVRRSPASSTQRRRRGVQSRGDEVFVHEL